MKNQDVISCPQRTMLTYLQSNSNRNWLRYTWYSWVWLVITSLTLMMLTYFESVGDGRLFTPTVGINPPDYLMLIKSDWTRLMLISTYIAISCNRLWFSLHQLCPVYTWFPQEVKRPRQIWSVTIIVWPVNAANWIKYS